MSFLATGGGNLGTAYGAIIIGTDTSIRNLNILGGALRQSGANAKNAGQDFFTAGIILSSIGATGEKALKSIISGGATFEQTMSGIVATLGKDALPIMGQFRDEALQIGKDSNFTANEVGVVMETLAKAGVSAKDILSGATAAVIDLAAATGESTDTSARLITDAINIFGLAGSDATSVADTLTTGINQSSASAADMEAGFRNLAPVVANFGGNVGDVTAAVATFTNYGLKGADAGVSLARGITQASKATPEAIASMQKYGITVFDAQGKFVGFPALFDNLRTSLGNVSDAEREAAISTIFGAEAQDVMSDAVKHGADDYKRIRSEVDKTGTAMDSANARLDNLAGDWEKFTGSVDTARIQIFETINGILRKFVQALTFAANAFIGLPAPVKAATAALLAFVTVLGLAGGSYLLFGNRIKSGLAALRSIGFGLGLISPELAILIALLAGLGIAYKTNIFGFRDAIDGLGEAVKKDFTKIKEGWKVAKPFLDYLMHTTSGDPKKRSDAIILSNLSGALIQLGVSAKHAGEVVTFLAAIHQPFRQMYKDVVVGKRALGDFFDIITGGDSSLRRYKRRLEIVFGKKAGDELFKSTKKMRNGIRDLREEFKKNFGFDPGKFISLNKALRLAAEGFSDLSLAIQNRVLPFLGVALSKALDVASRGIEFLANHMDDLRRVADFVGHALSVTLGGALDFLSKLLHGDIRGAFEDAVGWFQNLGSAALSLKDWILDVAAPKVKLWASDVWTWLKEKYFGFANAIGRLADWVLDVAVPKVTGWVVDVAGNLWDWFTKNIPGLTTLIGNIVGWTLDVGLPLVIGDILDVASDVWGFIKKYVPGIEKLAGQIVGWFLDVGVPFVTGDVFDAAGDMWKFIVGVLPSIADIAGKIAGWFLDVALPIVIGGVLDAARDMWTFLKTAAAGVGEVAGEIGSWLLDIAGPTISGDIITYAQDTWGFITTAVDGVSTLAGSISDWLLNVAYPTLVGNIALLSADPWKWIETQLTGLENWTGNILTWSLNLAVPALKNTAEDVAGWIGKKLNDLGITATLATWSMLLNDPNDIKFSGDLTHPVQKKVNENETTTVLLYKWYLTLTEPKVNKSDKEISDAAQKAINPVVVTSAILKGGWHIIMGTPALRGIFGVPAAVNQALNDIEPVRSKIDKWNIDLGAIGRGIIKYSSPGGWAQAGADAGLAIAANLGIFKVLYNKKWSLNIGIPGVHLGFSISSLLDAAINGGAGLIGKVVGLGPGSFIQFKGAWHLSFNLPNVSVPSYSDIKDAVLAKITALGDITIKWPNALTIDFPDFGIGDTPSNTDVSTSLTNAKNEGRAQQGGGAAAGGFTNQPFAADKIDTSGLDKIQTAFSKLTGIQSGITSTLTTIGTNALNMAKAFTTAEPQVSGAISLMSTNITSKIEAAMFVATVKVSKGTTDMTTNFTTFATNSGVVVGAGMTVLGARILTAMGTAKGIVSSTTSTMLGNFRTFAFGASVAGRDAGNGFSNGLTSALDVARHAVGFAVADMRGTMGSVGDGLYDTAYAAGANLTQGLIDGMNSLAGILALTAIGLSNTAANAFANASKQKSPSKLWAEMGENNTQGLIMGTLNNLAGVMAASQQISSAAVQPMLDALTGAVGGLNNVPLSQAVLTGGGATTNINIAKVSVEEAQDIIKWGKFVDDLSGSKTSSGV